MNKAKHLFVVLGLLGLFVGGLEGSFFNPIIVRAATTPPGSGDVNYGGGASSGSNNGGGTTSSVGSNNGVVCTTSLGSFVCTSNGAVVFQSACPPPFQNAYGPACPPPVPAVAYTPPAANVISFNFFKKYQRGTITTGPAGDFYVFLNTCAWSPDSTLPDGSTVYTETQTGPGYAATFTIQIRPDGVVWNWGDGTTSRGTTAQRQNFKDGSCPAGSGNSHVYKKVNGSGVTITATETLHAKISISWVDGNFPFTHSLPTQTVDTNLTWPGNGPHRIYQVEPVPHS